MRSLIVIVFLFLNFMFVNAQTINDDTEGIVSFISSQSTYVKFQSTIGLSIGDTLYSVKNNLLTPSLIINNLSSKSVVCSTLNDFKFVINDKIIAKPKIKSLNIEKKIIIKNDTLIKQNDTVTISDLSNIKPKNLKQKINGQFSVSSFSNFSNTPAKNSYIANYVLHFAINNIAESRFSMESNILFRQENGEWNNVQNNIFNGLKIYSLSLKYDFKNNTYVSIGRKINPNISNIGAIDGLQFEKTFKKLYTGGFLGSRPHYTDYSYNLNLMQYGAYIGHNLQTGKGNIQNSLAIVEQRNNSKTDRRFIYFQHSNSLIKNINMFYSLELDLYKVLNGQNQNTLSLTTSYLSIRYRPFRKLNISGTYDSRKNVIYYETDKNYLNSIIESESRQGIGFLTNYSISQNIFTGIRLGYRYQKADINASKNANFFITHSDVFKSKISTTLSVTALESNYMNGNIYNIRFSRSFKSGKINLSSGYSFVNYKILNNELAFKQHIADLSFSSEFIKKMFLSANFETSFEKPNQFYRLYLQLRKRF